MPAPPCTHHLESYDQIRVYIERYDIEPNPANYALLYHHYVLGEANLAEAVTKLIELGYAPETPDSIDGSALAEEDLQVIADNAQEQLAALGQLVNTSHEDARGFGDALEGSAQSLASDKSGVTAINTLMDLTRTMISKTRAAEQQLRARGETMISLQASLADARSKADTDLLTGLSNRRAFERMLGASTERAISSGRPLSLAICDVDHFKSINDQFGHVTGDRVLKLIGDILTDHCGKRGHVFRFGGEEFVLLFEELAVEDAFDLVDAARRDLADRSIVKKETNELLGPITFSAGIGGLPPTIDAGGLLRVADRALYAAKANGRNCSIHADRTIP
ncbi:MAG: GGDEF domain-containing protein [Pseudomonadota bacterium]